MTRYPSVFRAEVKAEERTQLLLKTVQLNGPLGVRKMIDWHEVKRFQKAFPITHWATQVFLYKMTTCRDTFYREKSELLPGTDESEMSRLSSTRCGTC